MGIIGPHVYHYLHHPLLSSAEAMLYYALEHLVYTGAISFDHNRVHLGHGEHHIVERLFLHRAADPAALPAPEAAALSLIPEGRAFSLSDLRHQIKRTYPHDQYKAYKAGIMAEHLKSQGLLSSPHTASSEGSRAYRQVHHLLNQVEHDEDQLLKDPAELQHRLNELGSNVVLLHHSLLAKLHDQPHLDERMKTMLILQTFLDSGGYYHEKMMG
ncbi:MAG: hypothetical protein J5I62_05845 [Flavobacteriales bacterium]|nr:hypothetical protein [Flavobacteriales bacterium]